MGLNIPRNSVVAAAAIAGALTLAAKNASAADVSIGLEPTGPAEKQVEWTQARSPNLVTSLVSETGRHIRVVATTNAPVELDGACPPPSQYPGWKLDTSAAPKPGRDSAEVDELAVERTGENGTFRLRTTAPARPGQVLRTQVKCVHVVRGAKTGDGPDGKPNTADDVYGETVDDTEVLTAEIGAVAGWPGNQTAPLEPFLFRGNGGDGEEDSDGEESGSEGGVPVELSAALASTTPTVGKPETGAGFIAEASIDPVDNGLWGRVPLKLAYRLGETQEGVTDTHGENPVTADVRSHCVFGSVGWKPGNDYVRAGVDLGAGPCHAEGARVVSPDLPGDGTAKVDPVTGVAGRASLQLEVGAPSIGVRAGVDAVFGNEDPFQFWGANVGAYARF